MTAIDTALPRSAHSVGVARRLVNEHGGRLTSQQRDDAALMVSELVTNALVHGIGTISLRIDVEAEALRIEVSDQGAVALVPTSAPGARGGWGLLIVDRLSNDWGVLDHSTKVWFRIGRPHAEH